MDDFSFLLINKGECRMNVEQLGDHIAHSVDFDHHAAILESPFHLSFTPNEPRAEDKRISSSIVNSPLLLVETIGCLSKMQRTVAPFAGER
jgi:hypothetical protein